VLTRGTDHRYEAVVRGDGRGVALFADGREVGRAEDVALPDGVPTTVSFAQVDYVLRLSVGGRLVLRHDLPAPEVPKRDALASSAIVRVSDGVAWIDPQRLERDVYYVQEAPDVEELGPDQYFMLGDNSSNSSDSRSNGPVHRSRLVGSPLLVVWPPSRVHVPR
jgi:signal peptidase S26 family